MWESVCGCVHTGFLLLVRWLVGWVLQPSCASFLTFSNPYVRSATCRVTSALRRVTTWWGSQLLILRKHLLSNGMKTQGKKHGHPV